jgi:hypothetical protein
MSMRVYSVFLRDHGRVNDQNMLLVKEGFSWPAFVFTFLWALWGRMWWPAIALFSIIVLTGWGAAQLGFNEGVETVISISLGLAIGFVGNDIRRWSLERQGYQEVALVTGRNTEDAMRRFLDDVSVDRDGIYP